MARNTTPRKNATRKTVETLKHDKVSRMNIPTAEYQSVMQKEEQRPIRMAYERRNRDLDPQLVWRGKDEQGWSALVVHAPPLYIQEKVHPKVLIDDLLKQTRDQRQHAVGAQPDLFADFNGIPQGVDKTEFYHHEQNWSNRMILGDSLQVMASLAEREGLRGKVQCIYLDPPYGIKFNSNFQWSTTSRDVKDGNVEHITREPEQVKAFGTICRAEVRWTKSTSYRPRNELSSAASLWPLILATWCSTPLVALAPPPMSPSNGAAAGSPSTLRGSLLPSPVLVLWVPAIRTTCLPTHLMAS